MIEKTSGKRKAILTSANGQASSSICSMLKQWRTVLKSKLKHIQTDGAKEIAEHLVRKLAEKNGAVITTPPANTAAMNGTAKRSVRTLKAYCVVRRGSAQTVLSL